MKIHKGDKVRVLQGKDQGKTGEVARVRRRDGSIVVTGVNLYKRHLRPSGKQKGGVVEKERSLPAGKVALICPLCNKPVRVGIKVKGGEKVRVCRRCLKDF